MIIKLDMQKAFDKVSWTFLLQVLKKFGFSEHFCLLITNSLDNNFFSILNNGAPVVFSKTGQRGKQGDPISPLLVIIIMVEVLSRGLFSSSLWCSATLLSTTGLYAFIR